MPDQTTAATRPEGRSFSVNFDYRCPFARIAHDHVLAGLDAGAAWDVRFVPFSLGQVHVADGEPDIWSRPDDDSGLLALQVAVAVRDAHPERFRAVHAGLFSLRHDRAGDLRDRQLISEVLEAAGVDPAAVWEAVDGGSPLTTVEKEHVASDQEHSVWGVPTFVVGDRAAFVRLLERPVDGADAVTSVERVLDLLDWQGLNEFKHTSIPR